MLFRSTLAIVAGCVFSLFASTQLDGLEWSLFHVMNDNSILDTGVFHSYFDKLQQLTMILPEYSHVGLGEMAGTSLSGLMGIALVMLSIFSFRLFASK